MIFYLIGINYKRIPYALREEIYHQREKISYFWDKMAPGRTAVLITCNRLEIYGAANNFREYLKDIVSSREKFGTLFSSGYIKSCDKAVFMHALRLATGLDSQVKGELQILEQIKTWMGRERFPDILRRFWEEVLESAESIRKNSGLDKAEHNIASLVFHDLFKKLHVVSRQKILVAGTGRVARLFADFKPPHAELYFAAHKNYEKARSLAEKTKGRSLLFKDAAGVLKDMDALVSVTSSPHLIFKKDDFRDISLGRTRPLYAYDLSLPYDIDPETRNIRGVVLRNFDNFDELFRTHEEKIRVGMQWAEYLVGKAIGERKRGLEDYDFKGWDTAEQIGYKAS